MTKGIYAYIDKKNNQIVYVGKDSSIHEDKRHKQHFYPSRYDAQQINRVLQNNPDRYTYQRLWEVEDCTDNHLNQIEIYFTDKYNPKFSYTKGGDGTSGYKWSDEQKKKISGKNNPMYGRTGKSNPIYGRTGENNHMYGKKCPEHSERMKGEKNPMYNKRHTENSKRKMSKTKSKRYNTTGFYKVSISNCSSCKKGFTWRYRYCIDSQHKSISSTDLNKLKEKVLEQDLEWKIIDEEKAQRSVDLNKGGIL